MLDFGWAEFALIGLVLLLVIGPKDIPNLMYQAGKIFRRLHYMKFALGQQFDSFMEKADASVSSAAAATNGNDAETSKDSNAEVNTNEEPEISLEMDSSNPFFVEGDEEADMDGDLESDDVIVSKPKGAKT